MSLPATLIALAVGLLLIVPLLASTSTGMLGTRAADQALLRHYSLDAGVEYAIWKLRYDAAFRASVEAVPLTPVPVTPAMSLNGFSPSITATALNVGGWDTRANTPDQVPAGGALVFAKSGALDVLYAFRGGNRAFWQYSIAGDTWTIKALAPGNPGDGAGLTWDGGNLLYGLRGGNQQAFWSYSIPGNSWTTLASTPARVRGGGAVAYHAGYVYAFRGDGTQEFWRYDVVGTSWASRANPPGNVGPGGSLVYTSANQFFALQGGGATGFWRYDSLGNGWTTLALVPAAVNNGGALAYNRDDYIYAFHGNGATDFWRYSILGDNWSTDDSAPADVDAGGSLAYADDTYVYALRGSGQDDFWRHSGTPSRYDIVAQVPGRTTTVRIQISS